MEALKEKHSFAELAQKYGIHPIQINAWKRNFPDGDDNPILYKEMRLGLMPIDKNQTTIFKYHR
jgi:uncharacterized protein YjcR